jgi:hypothetical protein
LKSESLPDISKLTGAEGSKKAKVDGGIVRTGTNKGDEFTDFSFKEGNTAVVKIQDIFIQEKGRDAVKKADEQPAQARVKGGVKATKKAASKSAGRTKRAAATASTKKADTSKSVDKILKYTPNKSSSRKETPQKSASVPPASTAAAAKKSTTGGKKQTPAMPSPGGKLSTKTVDEAPMAQFKRYLDWHKKLTGGKPAAGKVLGKRSSTGKASAASGKGSKASKRSKK